MTRPRRPDFTNTYHHAIVRGVDGLPIFNSPRKRKQFLAYVRDARQTNDLHIYAFGFLPNHWHVLLRRSRSSMARFFQTVKSRFTVWYNREFDRNGTLYDGRYYSSLVEAEAYFQRVWRYVQTQGVHAGLYEQAQDDPGSTAGFYAGTDSRHAWIDWEIALRTLDVPRDDAKSILADVKQDDLPRRRERDQYFVATDDYVEKYMQIRKSNVREGPREESPVSWETLMNGVVELFGDDYRDIQQPTKTRKRRRIRASLAYAGRHYGHKTTGEIADWLGVRPATVSRMIQDILQDDPEYKERWDRWFGE